MKYYLTTTALALVLATVSAKADLITNGNFSGGDTSVCHGGEGTALHVCPGWTVTLGNGPALEFNAGARVVITPAGVGFVTFGGVLTTDDVISQVIPTVAGQMYRVSFQFGSNNPGEEIGGVP